jgi:hypothetical protein
MGEAKQRRLALRRGVAENFPAIIRGKGRTGATFSRLRSLPAGRGETAALTRRSLRTRK